MVAQHDATAQQTGARIVVHCGNDCIPWDLTVFEMHKHAQSKGAELVEAQTFGEFGTGAMSGGTLTTAIYQLGKQRSAAKPDFDPLLRTRDGRKSESLTKIANPKKDVRGAATRTAAAAFASASAPPPPPPHEDAVRGPPLPAGLGGRVRAVRRAVDHGTRHGQLRTTLQRAARVCALMRTVYAQGMHWDPLRCSGAAPTARHYPPPTSAAAATAAAAAVPRPNRYSPNLVYGDALLRGHPTMAQWVGEKAVRCRPPPTHRRTRRRRAHRLAQRAPPTLLPQYTTLVAAAVVMPSLFQRFLPGPGEGPSREAMESNFLNLHAIGKMVDAASGQQTTLKAKYHFPGDTGYLYTAKMLVEAGMQLLEDKGQGGVLSPAAAFGSSGKLVLRLDKELGAKLEVSAA